MFHKESENPKKRLYSFGILIAIVLIVIFAIINNRY
jgi:hypothetical protein